MIRKLLMCGAAAAAVAGCEREPEQGVPPSAVSDSAILADTARRDKVEVETPGTGN